MKIAYLKSGGGGEIDLRMAAIAADLSAAGRKVVGLVQINTPRPKRDHCDMDLQVLPDGPLIRITQDLGPGARGCLLDPDALERAVREVHGRIDAQTDLLLINKFGQQEAEGRGFRNAIATAVELDVPVLVGLNGLNEESFLTFSDGLAKELRGDDILQWLAA